jgi:hypothetical protein
MVETSYDEIAYHYDFAVSNIADAFHDILNNILPVDKTRI